MTHSAVDWLTIFIIIQQWYWYQFGETALNNAAHGGHLEIVRFLVDRGANIQVKNKVS